MERSCRLYICELSDRSLYPCVQDGEVQVERARASHRAALASYRRTHRSSAHRTALMAARVRRRFNCSGLTPEQLHTQVLTLPRAELRYVRTVASLKAARVPYTLFNGTDGAQV